MYSGRVKIATHKIVTTQLTVATISADHVKKTDHARFAQYARIVLNKWVGEYSSPSPPLFLTVSPSLAIQ